MSEQQPYPFQQFGGQFNPPAPPPPKRNRHWLRWTLLAIAALAVAGGAGTAANSGNAKHTTHTAVPSPSATVSVAPVEQTTSVDPGPVYTTPTAATFTITLKILTKDCFDTAGCNVTYRPQLAMNVPAGSLDPSVTYDVSYVIRGGSSGAQADTIFVTGDQYRAPDQGFAQTATEGAKLTAAVTAVEAE